MAIDLVAPLEKTKKGIRRHTCGCILKRYDFVIAADGGKYGKPIRRTVDRWTLYTPCDEHRSKEDIRNQRLEEKRSHRFRNFL
jgi:hypothetical protein